jgi:hypothetical protein
MSNSDKNCWVQMDENGNIIIVGECSEGIPPQIPESDRFNKNDQIIKDFFEAVRNQQNN